MMRGYNMSYEITHTEYMKQLHESEKQFDVLWGNADPEDSHLTDPLGWL